MSIEITLDGDSLELDCYREKFNVKRGACAQIFLGFSESEK